MSIEGKTCIVTGGANGIGRLYCDMLIREGANVVIADLDLDGAHELANDLNEQSGEPRTLPLKVNVASEEDTREMAHQTIDRFKAIDILVNNAGSYPHVDFEQITYEAWRNVMTINLDSVFLCSRAVLPQMKSQGAGKIINVSTNLVWAGLAGMVHYISAKAGIIGFTRSLAREIGVHGITVNALAPGAIIPYVELNEISKQRVQMIVDYQCIKRPERAVDLVGALRFLCSSDSDFISGQVLTVDGGLTNH